MTLHICFNGLNDNFNRTQAENLCLFLTKKSYNVKYIKTPAITEIKYILNNYNLTTFEEELLKAVNRTYTIKQNKEYEIIITTNTTPYNIPTKQYKQINRQTPLVDLVICFDNETLQFNKKYNNHKHIIHIKPEGKYFEEITKKIFEILPTCNWCGRLFTKTKHNKKYCSDKCRKYSLSEQYRINNRNQYHKYKDVMSERQKGGLGSKGANLHGRADKNPAEEYRKVVNAKKSLGLKPIQ